MMSNAQDPRRSYDFSRDHAAMDAEREELEKLCCPHDEAWFVYKDGFRRFGPYTEFGDAINIAMEHFSEAPFCIRDLHEGPVFFPGIIVTDQEALAAARAKGRAEAFEAAAKEGRQRAEEWGKRWLDGEKDARLAGMSDGAVIVERAIRAVAEKEKL